MRPRPQVPHVPDRPLDQVTSIKVKLGSRMIDTSLRTKLDNLRAAMKGAS